MPAGIAEGRMNPLVFEPDSIKQMSATQKFKICFKKKKKEKRLVFSYHKYAYLNIKK